MKHNDDDDDFTTMFNNVDVVVDADDDADTYAVTAADVIDVDTVDADIDVDDGSRWVLYRISRIKR